MNNTTPTDTRSNEASSSSRESRGERLIPLLCLLGAGSLIGLSTDLAQVASDNDVPSLAFLTWSVIGAAIILTGVSAVRGRLPALTRTTVLYFVIAAVVSVAAPQLIFFSAVPKVGASFVALSIAFPPLYTYLGALALKTEHFNTRRAAGVAVSFAGAALLAAFQLSQPDAAIGCIALTLVGPIILAIGNLYRSIKWPQGTSPDELAPGMLAAAGIILLFLGPLPGLSLTVPATGAAIGVIAAQTATFSIQYLLFFILQQRGGPVYLSLLGSVAAVVGSAIAIIILGDTAPKGLVPAGILIAIGIALLTSRGAKSTTTSHQSPSSKEDP